MNDTTRAPRPSPTTVLVVEDDLPVREMAGHILEGAGLRVLSARSAEEALELAGDAAGIDLLFCDVVLPGATGLELAAQLVARRPDLPVIVTTGQRTDEAQQAVAATNHPLLPKPYTARGLLDAVGAALSREGPTP